MCDFATRFASPRRVWRSVRLLLGAVVVFSAATGGAQQRRAANPPAPERSLTPAFGAKPDAPPVPRQNVPRQNLLRQNDLRYIGAFRVPFGQFGDSEFAYGGTALAYHRSKNSLFIVGHDHHQAIAEIEIPAKIVHGDRPDQLATARVLQPFVNVLPRLPRQSLEGSVKIGGLLVVGERLIGSAYEYYDADGNAADSHFRLTSTELAKAEPEGFFRVGSFGGGFVGGYMTPIPEEWRQLFKASHLTGQAGLAIVSRTSAGPGVFGFDPTRLGENPTPAIPYVYYPITHPLRNETSTNPVYNLTTEIRGVVFPPGTGSILFFGSHGVGEYCYGTPEECNDPVRGGKGTHSAGGLYEYQVWAYDARDLLGTLQSVRQPWVIQPYAVWTFDLPIDEPSKHLGGVAFDPESRRIFVSQLAGDRVGFAPNPLIHVFEVTSFSK